MLGLGVTIIITQGGLKLCNPLHILHMYYVKKCLMLQPHTICTENPPTACCLYTLYLCWNSSKRHANCASKHLLVSREPETSITAPTISHYNIHLCYLGTLIPCLLGLSELRDQVLSHQNTEAANTQPTTCSQGHRKAQNKTNSCYDQHLRAHSCVWQPDVTVDSVDRA